MIIILNNNKWKWIKLRILMLKVIWMRIEDTYVEGNMNENEINKLQSEYLWWS